MERNEKTVLLNLAIRLAFFDGLEEQWRHRRPIGHRGADRFCRHAFAGTKLANDLHESRLVCLSKSPSSLPHPVIADK
jgi:hypothetical protein